MTFKQLEAFYWVGHVKSFLQAAHRLHTTQSAISKRIFDLEETLGVTLFNRDGRSARLTEKGEEMMILAKRLLNMRDEVVDQISTASVIEKTIRLGVTELTSITWLPRLVSLINRHYPKIVIEPDVDMSVNLRDKLVADEIDLMIGPDVYMEPRFNSHLIGSVQNKWMCNPSLAQAREVARLHELGRFRLLADRSGPGIIYGQWFKSNGFQPVNILRSNSLVSIVALTLAGFGISYLPVHCMGPLVNAGLLVHMDVSPSLPDIHYAAIYKTDKHSELLASISMLAQSCCDFQSLALHALTDLMPMPGAITEHPMPGYI